MIKILLACIALFWSFITLLYFIALYDKITKPAFKNLNAREYMILGSIILLIWIPIYFAYKKIIKKPSR